MKRNILAIFLAVMLVAALVIVAAPNSKAADANVITAEANTEYEITDDSKVFDLNGQKNVTVNIADGVTLSVIDSANMELDGKTAGTLTKTGDGKIASVTLYGNYRYLKVENAAAEGEAVTYSFHPFNMAVTRAGINVKMKTVSLEAMFVANDVVRDMITDFGIKNITKGTSHSAKPNFDFEKNYDNGDSVSNNTANGAKAYYDLVGSLDGDLTETKQFCAYIKIDGIADPILGNQKVDVTPENVLGQINTEFTGYTSYTRKLALELYKNNADLQAALPKLAPRDISTGALTAGEIEDLQNLKPEDIPNSVPHVSQFAQWAYSAANINVANYLDQTSMRMAVGNTDYLGIFAAGKSGKYVLSPNTVESKYRPLLLKDYYGGTLSPFSKTLTANMLEPGDIFCAYSTTNGMAYYAGIYQGDSQFLIVESKSNVITNKAQEPIDFSDISTKFALYYVIRPEQVSSTYEGPRDISTGALTDAEKDRIASLNANDIPWAGYVNEVAKWVYGAADIDVAAYLDANNYRIAAGLADGTPGIFKQSKTGNYVLSASTVESKYRTMLLNDYYGGTQVSFDKAITAEMLEIGDIFTAFKPGAVSGTAYFTAVYQGKDAQGEHQFLIVDYDYNNGNYHQKYNGTVDFSNIATDFTVYYVLRPGQIATYEGPRDISTGALTDAEKDRIAALQPGDIQNAAWTLIDLAPYVYHTADIDISSYITSGNRPMFWELFGGAEGNSYPKAPGHKTYNSALAPMLVDGLYGGTTFPDGNSKIFDKESCDTDFQIGDLFVAWEDLGNNTWKYYTAVYQGDGVFLAADNTSGSYVYSHDSETVFAADISTRFYAYYVLRPSQLAK